MLEFWDVHFGTIPMLSDLNVESISSAATGVITFFAMSSASAGDRPRASISNVIVPVSCSRILI